MKFPLIILVLFVSGCSVPVDKEPAPQKLVEATWNRSEMNPEVLDKWQRSCALCHVAGEGGAPKMGNSVAWDSRLSQGMEMLLHNTIVGLNRMPPLGYCMDCSEEDFAAMIRLMAGEGL